MSAFPRALLRDRFPIAESTRRDVLRLVLAAVRRAVEGADQVSPAQPAPEMESELETLSARTDGESFDIRLRLDAGSLEVEVAPRGQSLGRAAGTQPAFGPWLRGRLRAQGMSQETAARRIGVSPRTVGRWVRGDTQPRFRDLSRLREAFGPLPQL